MDVVENYKRYDFKQCCPNLTPQFDQIAPQIDFTVIKPTSTLNNDGAIHIRFTGLYSRYYITWSDMGEQFLISGSSVRNGLKPGVYTISISAINNPDCVWVYEFEVPRFEELDVELYYLNNLTSPVPRMPLAGITTIPDNEKIYWNDNKILKRGTSGQTQCYEITITGGTPPYTIVWDDYLSYGGVVPGYLVGPSLPPPAQTTNSGTVNVNGVLLESRPPVVLDKIAINNKTDVTEVCINLAVFNGNGWIRATVTDSNFPTQAARTIWLYLKQSPIV